MLEHTTFKINLWEHATYWIKIYQSKNLQTLTKQCETYHDIAMTMTSFDIPVVTSSPDIDVTLTSSHADGMTTAPGGLTKSKEDTTEGVTATKMPTPSKKYFFKVLFSIVTGYNCQVIFANLELNDSVTRTSDSQPRNFFMKNWNLWQLHSLYVLPVHSAVLTRTWL